MYLVGMTMAAAVVDNSYLLGRDLLITRLPILLSFFLRLKFSCSARQTVGQSHFLGFFVSSLLVAYVFFYGRGRRKSRLGSPREGLIRRGRKPDEFLCQGDCFAEGHDLIFFFLTFSLLSPPAVGNGEEKETSL